VDRQGSDHCAPATRSVTQDDGVLQARGGVDESTDGMTMAGNLLYGVIFVNASPFTPINGDNLACPMGINLVSSLYSQCVSVFLLVQNCAPSACLHPRRESGRTAARACGPVIRRMSVTIMARGWAAPGGASTATGSCGAHGARLLRRTQAAGSRS